MRRQHVARHAADVLRRGVCRRVGGSSQGAARGPRRKVDTRQVHWCAQSVRPSTRNRHRACPRSRHARCRRRGRRRGRGGRQRQQASGAGRQMAGQAAAGATRCRGEAHRRRRLGAVVLLVPGRLHVVTLVVSHLRATRCDKVRACAWVVWGGRVGREGARGAAGRAAERPRAGPARQRRTAAQLHGRAGRQRRERRGSRRPRAARGAPRTRRRRPAPPSPPREAPPAARQGCEGGRRRQGKMHQPAAERQQAADAGRAVWGWGSAAAVPRAGPLPPTHKQTHRRMRRAPAPPWAARGPSGRRVRAA